MYPGNRAVLGRQLNGMLPDGSRGIGVSQSADLLDGIERELMLSGQRAASVSRWPVCKSCRRQVNRSEGLQESGQIRCERAWVG
jgi:hypothetical protein